jgi:hypothetical protein
MVFKKKLHVANPSTPSHPILTYRTRQKNTVEATDPLSLERGVRQLLADKISGTLVGLWLLIPEHLRLGTWDLLCGWANKNSEYVQPRLALQVVHEAALCVTGVRQHRGLSQKGFEVANGLPFVASDQAIHELLESHTVDEAQQLQRALGQLRRASGHFQGHLLAIDPHRLTSYSQRQMVRLKDKSSHPAQKVAQTFFCLDADTAQPVCMTTATSSRSVAQATPELLNLAVDILNPTPHQTLVLADVEHYSHALFEHVQRQTPFDLLVPMPHQPRYQKTFPQLPADLFQTHWIGFATAKRSFHFTDHPQLELLQLIQRTGVSCPYTFKGFLATADRNELETLSQHYPQRWHVEEFFHAYQDQGWKRAGTLNLHIRYGQMTLALVAQAAIHQLRQRLGEPWRSWESVPWAQKFFRGLDGDIRVHHDTILVTLYNAPQVDQWRHHFEHLPEKLAAENINPKIPWLFNYKLDFRFK